MKDFVIIAVLIAVLAMSIIYIVKAKKNGVKCIGCPSGNKCGDCGCGCGEHNTHNE